MIINYSSYIIFKAKTKNKHHKEFNELQLVKNKNYLFIIKITHGVIIIFSKNGLIMFFLLTKIIC